MQKILGREPILFLAAVQTAVALVAAFGLKLSAEQIAAITAFTAAVLGVIARSKVSPV